MKEISILFTRHECGGWKENINFPLKVIGFYDLKFTHIALDFS